MFQVTQGAANAETLCCGSRRRIASNSREARAMRLSAVATVEQGERDLQGQAKLHVFNGRRRVGVGVPVAEFRTAPPAQGEVACATRFLELDDKGLGKLELIRAQTMLFHQGDAFAKLERVVFARNVGGFGGSPGVAPSPAPAPEGPADFEVDLATDPPQAPLYRLNGTSTHCTATPRSRAAPASTRRSCTVCAPSGSSRTRCGERCAPTGRSGCAPFPAASTSPSTPARPFASKFGRQALSAPASSNATQSRRIRVARVAPA